MKTIKNLLITCFLTLCFISVAGNDKYKAGADKVISTSTGDTLCVADFLKYQMGDVK